MSLSSDFNAIRKKKEKEKLEEAIKNIESSNFAPVDTRGKTPGEIIDETIRAKKAQAEAKEAQEKNTWFQSGRFTDKNGDGISDDIIGDVLLTGLGTIGDVGLGLVRGALGLAEGVSDLGLYGASKVADWVGADGASHILKEAAKDNTVNNITKPIDDVFDRDSLLGDKVDVFTEGLGQIAGIILTGGAAGAAGASTAGVSALTTGVTFASSAGHGMTEAYQGGATDGEAWAYGGMVGSIDAITEAATGGLGRGISALGISRGIGGLDDIFAQKLTSKISNQVVKNAAQFGIKSGFEGLEEVASGAGSAAAKKLTYMSDEELSQLIKDERLLDQFVVGTVTSAFAQSGVVPGMSKGSLIESYKNKTDFITGLTQNETAVVEKEVEKRIAAEEKDGKKLTSKEKNKIYDEVVKDLDKGGISIDTIEEVLGGDTYKSYKDILDNENSLSEQEKNLNAEFTELNKMKNGEMTGEQTDRREELRNQLKDIRTKIEASKNNTEKSELKAKLSNDVFGIAKDSRLVNSYIEDANKHKAFEADVTKYKSEAAKQTVQNAIDAGREGLIHNGRDAHSFVDLAVKMSEDKGYVVEFHTTESIAKLKADPNDIYGLNKQDVDPNKVRAFVSEGQKKIIVNLEAGKSLNSLVGHEITDTFRETDGYDALQKFAFDYAKTKGELDSRRKSVEDRYAKIVADIDGELTSDIVGDYLFTDEDFVRHLSTKHRNIAQKIYDEVKYLIKLATAGSKEYRQLEKLKHQFEKVWRENATAQGDTKFSVDDENAIDNYSQTHYNRFGWAREAEAITFKELNDLQSKLHNKNEIKGKTPYGEAIYEINNNPETGESVNNVIAFTKGKADNFTITRTVRIYAYDEDTVGIFRKDIYENTSYRALENLARAMGDDLLRYYDRNNYPNYRAYAESKRAQQSGSDSEGNTSANRIGDQRSGTLEQTQSNEIAPTKVSSKDDAFFDGEKTKFSLSDKNIKDVSTGYAYGESYYTMSYRGNDL